MAVLAFETLNFWVNSVRELLGMSYRHIIGLYCSSYDCSSYDHANLLYSEVYKARSKKDTSVVALKRILMHNEKDGVRMLFCHLEHQLICFLEVSDNCSS